MSSSVPAEPAEPSSAIVAAKPRAAVEAAGASGAVKASGNQGTASCANCGTVLTGKYCGECGQRHHDHPVHDVRHFIGEAIEDLTHADSRLWQTLTALLFRPGFLTREFLDGRRARYLPPIRLYLVVSVIFFIIAGLQAQHSTRRAIIISENGKSFHYQVVPLSKPAGGTAQIPHQAAGDAVPGLATLAQTPAGRQSLCAQSGTYIAQHGGWLADLGPRVERNCAAAFAEGGLERLNQAFEHNLERAMFLLLPLLALVMKPLYLRPRRYYVEHLLFFLHDHAFVFVLLGVSTLLQMITSSDIVLNVVGTAIVIYIPIYYYRAMRRVYGQGPALTLSKISALGVAYFFLGVVMLAATVSYSFLML